MPRNGFSFTVRVSCQIDLICLFDLFSQLGKDIALAADRNIFWLIVVLYINTELAFRQIAYMSARSIHLVICS